MAPSFGPNVPLLNKARSYDTWKKEIELWCKITELSKEKLGISITIAVACQNLYSQLNKLLITYITSQECD
jgi:hypothetical protein